MIKYLKFHQNSIFPALSNPYNPPPGTATSLGIQLYLEIKTFLFHSSHFRFLYFACLHLFLSDISFPFLPYNFLSLHIFPFSFYLISVPINFSIFCSPSHILPINLSFIPSPPPLSLPFYPPSLPPLAVGCRIHMLPNVITQIHQICIFLEPKMKNILVSVYQHMTYVHLLTMHT